MPLATIINFFFRKVNFFTSVFFLSAQSRRRAAPFCRNFAKKPAFSAKMCIFIARAAYIMKYETAFTAYAAGQPQTGWKMVYIKKLCILKQVASGFAADGKKVSALLTAEKSGGRLSLSLALIGFAPLSSGRYRFLVCDGHGTAESFDIPTPAGTSVKKYSELDIADNFCCLVCFAGGSVSPVAFGKCGDKTYDIKKLCALLAEEDSPGKKPRTSETEAETPADETHAQTAGGKKQGAADADGAGAAGPAEPPYDDEVVATENYYEFEKDGTADENKERETEKARTGGENAGKDEDAQSLFRFAGSENLAGNESACYFETVKKYLDMLFEKYPPEEQLAESIPFSRWVKVVFARNKYYTVGVISDEKKPKYICYGVPAESYGDPPDALKGFCSFMPLSVFDMRGKGYWMMFQDAETGACVKIAQT